MTDESVRAMCNISRALSTGDEDLQQWAYQGFLVPRLQAACKRVANVVLKEGEVLYTEWQGLTLCVARALALGGRPGSSGRLALFFFLAGS